jgi:hypothetical protein
VAAVVNNAGQEVFTTTRQGLNSLLSGLVLTWASSLRRLRVLGREHARRRQRRLVVGVGRVARAVVVLAARSTEGLAREDVGNGWQSVICLRGWDVVNVRRL